MRRIAFGVAGAAAAAIAAVVSLAHWKPLQGADAALLDGFRNAAGLIVQTNGATTFSLFPTPRVRIDGVSVARPGQPAFAVARELVGAPRLIPLLRGRVELGEITLKDAVVELDRLPFGEMISAIRSAGPGGEAPPEIRILGGRLDWNGRSIEKVDVGFAWPGAGRPLAISGYGTMAGRSLEGSFSLADPAAFARGDDAPFRARLEAAGARVVFDGTMVDADGPRFTGDLSARAASLRETLGWLGLPAPRRSSPLSGFSLAGKATADKDGLAIANAELGLEGGSFLGAGRLTTIAGRTSIEATLDSDKLDLGPYVRGIAPTMQHDGRWNPRPIDLGTLAAFDLDLRLSASLVKFGKLRLGPTAATVLVSKGAFDLAVGEASTFGGTMGGRLTIAPDPAGARVRGQVTLAGVDLQDALKRFVARPMLTGELSAELSVEGAGLSTSAVVAALGGRGSARLTDGTFEGFARSRTLALVGLRGTMPFSEAKMNLTIRDGVAHTDDLAISGAEASLSMSGDASLVRRDLKLSGMVRPQDGRWSLPVKLEGPFWAPKLKPDLTSAPPHAEALRSRAAVAADR